VDEVDSRLLRIEPRQVVHPNLQLRRVPPLAGYHSAPTNHEIPTTFASALAQAGHAITV
jgi:hypothetical protein